VALTTLFPYLKEVKINTVTFNYYTDTVMMLKLPGIPTLNVLKKKLGFVEKDFRGAV
jgi:hypothetical protein